MKLLRPALHAAFALLLLASANAPASAQIDPKFDPSKLSTPPLHPIPVLKPERFALPNGIVVFLLEDHTLPVVTGAANLKASPLWIPAGKVGVGRLTGDVMRSGGTAAHSGDWLDDRLAAIGASISTGITLDMASAGFRCLSDNTSEVVGLFAEVMRAPAFPQDKIDLVKVAQRQEIASRNDEMIPLLVRVATQAVYGKDSPFARQPEYATVEAIERKDCIEMHRAAFEPSRLVLAVYGDFKSAEMKKLLTAKLADWKGAKVPLPALPALPTDIKSRLVFAPKEDVTQSGIILTHLGLRVDDPDYPSMDVMQMGLGGGFQSRLVNRIRTERGLAYATGAGAGEGYQRPGLFIAYSLTKSESTMVALDLLREEVGKVVQAPFTPQEMETAKQSVQNLFVFNFEEPSAVLSRMAFFEAIGYPQDFLQRYQQALQTVTAQSVLEASRRKIHPDHMISVVVGKEKDFDRKLETAGLPVERVDITIPAPASKVSVGAATPEALAKGQEWLARAAELAGGSAAWAAIKSVGIEQEGTITIQGQTMTLGTSASWVLPNQWLIVQKLPMGEIKQGFDGTTGWISMMGQVQDHPKTAGQVKEEYERSYFHVFGHPKELEVQALDEPKTIDGVAYHVAFVKSDIVKNWMLYFAPDGALARMDFTADGPKGPALQTEIVSDWKAAGPVQYPRSVAVMIDGQPMMTGKVTEAKINPPLSADLFKKPSP
jgi:zinc protease